jgi:hypothetical protein
MRNRIGIFSLIFFAVALLLFWLFYPTEEEQILARFEELSDIASKSGAASTTADVHAEGTDNIRDSNRVESFSAQIDLRKIEGDWNFRQFIYIESLPGK